MSGVRLCLGVSEFKPIQFEYQPSLVLGCAHLQILLQMQTETDLQAFYAPSRH